MPNPAPEADVVERVEYCQALAEDRAQMFDEAAAEITRLRAELAEARRPDLHTMLGFEAGRADAAAEIERLRAEVAERIGADPECPYCAGTGERFWHAENCRSDDCALAGGIDDCAGVVETCPCVAPAPAPDPRDARIAKLDAALRSAAVRMEILTGRMRACHEETGKHELLDEAEMFCSETRRALGEEAGRA